MSEENKCVGLDCEMCGNTKCPNEEKEKIINGIDVSEYFVNHYDDSGKLYAVEYKGNPLELQNAVKRLQEENEGLKKQLEFSRTHKTVLDAERIKYEQALEEIRNYASVLYGEPLIDGSKIRLKSGMYRIKTKINEVLNDRN